MLAGSIFGVTPNARLYDRAVLKRVAIIAAVGLVLAGCSDDPAEEDGLLGALGRVRATAETRVAVEYGEPAAVRALMAKDEDRYQTLRGYGYGSIAMYSVTVEDTLGLDLDGFDGAIHVGEPPKRATVLWGEYDVAAVDGKLRGMDVDGKEGFGETRWNSGADHEIDLADGPFAGVVGPAQFNNIRTAARSFAFAPAAAAIDWVTAPGDETLAGDDVLAPLARCLGDVVAAHLMATGEAVGVREDGTEVICLDADKADVSDALEGEVPSTREPWDRMLPGAEVDQDGALARVTVPARDDKPVGRVLRLMVTRDLPELG
jgi:hypothetical protein